MKEKFDRKLIGALLRKQWREETYPYRRGNRNVVGSLLGFVLLAAIVAIFVIFFGQFTEMFLKIKTFGEINVTARSLELLTIVYAFVILFMTIGGIGQLNREIFAADDIKLFSAMPVGSKSIFAAKLVVIYAKQILISAVVVLTVNITFAARAPQPAQYWIVTALAVLLLPLITVAIASLIVGPYHFVKQKMNERFVVNFITITVVLAVLLYFYSVILNGVKSILLGDDLRYFFNESVMTKIGTAASLLYPSRLLANILIGQDELLSYLLLIAIAALCIVASVFIMRSMILRALQSRMAGSVRYSRRNGKIARDNNGMVALIKKEFLVIFRTPSYLFSYFSVALVMPLMVYFCMSVGVSLVDDLIGISCDFELATFLTILFGALTNVFCATNISRDGEMFYAVKAFPLGYKQVFFSKILLCLAVTAVSQLLSAILLLATGMLNWYMAIVVFLVGMLFGFVGIAVATRYDFRHAKFSTEEDGEIKESSNVVSVVIMLGMLLSFLVGGVIFVVKIITQLRHMDLGWLTYLIAIASGIISVGVSYLYLSRKLGTKYYEFEGGI